MSMPGYSRTRLMACGFSVIAALVGAPVLARAEEAVPLKREILALYDGAQEGEADFTRIHRFAELPLNHLGFILRFHDIRKALPQPDEMAQYRGVLTWFAGAVSVADRYRDWAGSVSQMNTRFVILGDVGLPINPTNLETINQLLALAGVRHTGTYFAPTLGTRQAQTDQNLIEFECRLGPVLPEYPLLDPTGTDTQIGLMLQTPTTAKRTVLVAIGKGGAYAAWNYEFCHQRPPLYRGKWHINPFAFFRAAFGAVDDPIPDTTTASGNRLYLGLLDNEGWTRPSKIDEFRDVAAGEVVLHELIEPFKGLPVTIGLHQNELSRLRRVSKQTQAALQRLVESPDVDVAQRGLQTTLSRFDHEYPSISNLAPIVSAGADRFINRPVSDEAAYRTPNVVGETGFSALEQTIANTEAPYRLKPFVLGYHAYAGEHPALLRAVRDRLRAAHLSTLTPISGNRYAAIVDGFLSARLERIGPSQWRISNRGALQTVRFDAAEAQMVDLQSSVGVLGQKRHGETLYVALDEAVEPAVVSLVQSPSSRPLPRMLSLHESRWLVRRLMRDECGLSFEAQGYGEGSFTWENADADRYTVTAQRAGQEIHQQTVDRDDAGSLAFVLPISARDPVDIRMSCADNSSPTQK